jgi:selenophosphate synthetase-related protein
MSTKLTPRDAYWLPYSSAIVSYAGLIARQGGQPGVFVKLAMTAVWSERILVKWEMEVTGMSAGAFGVA